MPEFLGYEAQEGSGFVEFSKLFGDLGASVTDAINTRQKERDAFSQITQENEQKINEYELGQNQTMNDLIMDGANNIRNQMYDWNKAADEGRMTRADYKRRQNNVMSYWKMLSESAKNYDTRSMEILNRQQPDENGVVPGSGFELFANQKYLEIADREGKTYTPTQRPERFI